MKHFNLVLEEAQRSLKRDGDLPLVAIGFDTRGRGFKLWMQIEKDEDKDRFCMAIAGNLMVHGAVEYYVLFTGWMVLLDKPDEELKTRPSNDPRRKEVMIVYGENHTETEAKLFVLERDAGGRLLHCDEREDLNEMVAGNSQMRFSRLLGDPKRKHSQEEVERMRALLKPMPEIFHIYGPQPLIDPTLN
ncbi:MAG: hypothetical protein JST84_02470 [Acidobacteria bacterium]|nr:hypothetical protein [Acidobacteriota bacterium]